MYGLCPRRAAATVHYGTPSLLDMFGHPLTLNGWLLLPPGLSLLRSLCDDLPESEG